MHINRALPSVSESSGGEHGDDLSDNDEEGDTLSEDIPPVEASTQDMRRHEAFVQHFGIDPCDNHECAEFMAWIQRCLRPDYNVHLVVWAERFSIKWHMSHIFAGHGRTETGPIGIWDHPGEENLLSDGNWGSPERFALKDKEPSRCEICLSRTRTAPRLFKNYRNMLRGLSKLIQPLKIDSRIVS